MSGWGQSRLSGASCRSSNVRNAPLATGPKKAACRDGPTADLRAAKKLRSWPKWWMAQTFCESNTNRRRDGRRSEPVQDVDQLSVRWRAPFAEGLDRVGFGQAVEPGE